METERFGRARARAVSLQYGSELRAAYHLIDRGLRQGSARLIAKGANLGARVNQHVLRNPLLPELEAVGKEDGFWV